MSELAPILIVDDDPDDKELIRQVCVSLKIQNELLYFDDGTDALEYLKTTSKQPFLILCDINMPMMNGLALRREIECDARLKEKAIPFVFLSTSARQKDVNEAFQLTVQGYFEKGHDYERLRKRINIIFEYWKECMHPALNSGLL